MQSELEAEGRSGSNLVIARVRASMCVAVLLALPLVLLRPGSSPRGSALASAQTSCPWRSSGWRCSSREPNAVLSQYLFARGFPGRLAAAQAGLAIGNLALTAGLLIVVRTDRSQALATLLIEAIGAVFVFPHSSAGVESRCVHSCAGWSQPLAAGAVAALPTLALALLATIRFPAAAPRRRGRLSVLFSGVAWRLALTEAERTLVRSLLEVRRRPSFEPDPAQRRPD